MRDAPSTQTDVARSEPNGNAHQGRGPLSRSQLSALVGSELGVSEWICIDQALIDAFADVTRDRQPIHIDEEVARAGPFGGTIAHGFLTLSLLSTMGAGLIPTLEGQRAVVNYGLNSLRFVAPVRSGERVRGHFVLKEVNERSPERHQLTIGVTVEIEHQPKPALVAEWLTLINT